MGPGPSSFPTEAHGVRVTLSFVASRGTKSAIADAWVLILAVLGAISAISSILTSNPAVQASTAASLVLVVAAVAWSRRSRDSIGKSTLKSLTSDPTAVADQSVLVDFEIRDAALDTDARQVTEFERVYFKDESIDARMLVGIWRRYRRGLTMGISRSTGRVVSAVGIWPITARSFDLLTTGLKSENDMLPRDISVRPVKRHWWIGGIVTDQRTRERHPSLTPAMIATALSKWAEDCPVDGDLHVVAVAVSDNGLKLIRRMGFVRTGPDDKIHVISGPAAEVLARVKSAFPFLSSPAE